MQTDGTEIRTIRSYPAPEPGPRELRVLHLIPSMLGGGAERQLALLAGEQGGMGLEVHVGVVTTGPNLPWLLASGATVHWLRDHGNHSPALLFDLVRLIRTVRPNVVQTWMLQMDIAGGLSSMITRTRWIMTERSSYGAYQSGLKRTVREYLGRFASAVIANSHEGSAYWRERLGKTKPCLVVRNAVPLDIITAARPLRPHFAEVGSRPFLLFAGRLAPEKNVRALLSGFARIASRIDAAIVICGAGPDRASLVELVDELALSDRVVFAGHSDQVWHWMKTAAAFVSLSRFEGQPNSVLEAMACRCPLIVSDIPEHREFLTAASARLVDPDDAVALANALTEVLVPSSDIDTRIRAAFGRVQAFSPRASASEYLTAYRVVLGEVQGS